MKIQIISRLNRNSQRSTSKQNKEKSFRTSHLNYIRDQNHIQTEYYPLYDAHNEEEETQSRQSNQYKLFFQDFHQKNAVIYQKHQRQLTKPHRQLEPLLTVIKESPKKLNYNKQTQYEFSFNKKQGTPSTIHTQLNDSPKDKPQPYFFNRAQKPKLRKFNSLMALKGQYSQREDTQPSFQGQKIALRKNCSLIKCHQHSYLNQPFRHKISLTTNNSEVVDCKRIFVENAQTQLAFAEQKERLAKIRIELNQIYQMRKPVAKLHLF